MIVATALSGEVGVEAGALIERLRLALGAQGLAVVASTAGDGRAAPELGLAGSADDVVVMGVIACGPMGENGASERRPPRYGDDVTIWR